MEQIRLKNQNLFYPPSTPQQIYFSKHNRKPVIALKLIETYNEKMSLNPPQGVTSRQYFTPYKTS